MVRIARKTGRRRLIGLAGLALVFAALPWTIGLASDPPVISLAIKSGHFIPETLEVPAGQKFKLRVANEGPAVEEFESSDLNRENIVLPGATLDIYLGPLERGSYGFFGDFHPDTARGRIIAK